MSANKKSDVCIDHYNNDGIYFGETLSKGGAQRAAQEGSKPAEGST